MALELEGIIKEKMKENIGGFKGNQYVSGPVQNSAPNQNKTKTRKEVAKIAGLAENCYGYQFRRILRKQIKDLKLVKN